MNKQLAARIALLEMSGIPQDQIGLIKTWSCGHVEIVQMATGNGKTLKINLDTEWQNEYAG